MTLKMALRWKNPDASSDINLRFKDIFDKGFVTGAEITPVPGVLQVDVSPFAGVNFDGAVVTSDADERVTVTDGQINYVVLRARYRLNDTPIIQVEVLTAAAYAADPELDWLHVVGVVDLSVGGPYSAVPTSRIFYEERHTVDQQGRTFWRDPVDTFGNLPVPPADFNQDGDVRMVLDTRSIYIWDDSGGTWDLMNEVTLLNHRDLEHSNGITGDSDPDTLVPDTVGSDMTVGDVPSGSFYTVNGFLLTSPLSTLTLDPAVEAGALRGVVQVAMDQTATSVTNYRVEKDVDALDISAAQIYNISDGHPLGNFDLVYTNGTNEVTWAGGSPVVITGPGLYRLYNDEATGWIEVNWSGVAPGVTVADGYIVNASLKDDDHLLVGYWYWDGAATVVSTVDKRVFGTLSGPELSTDFRLNELWPAREDLRGTPLKAGSVFSGGEASIVAGDLRVIGPVVCYLQGQRVEVEGIYSGRTLTGTATHYIYGLPDGTLANSLINPETNTNIETYAPICEADTAAGVVTTIRDTRNPHIQVSGQVAFAATYDPSTDLVELQRSGVTDDTAFHAGTVRGTVAVQSADYIAAETGRWTDNGLSVDHRFEGGNQTQDVYVGRSTDQDIGEFQVGNSTPSILGSFQAQANAQRYLYGRISGSTLSRVNDNNVEVAIGSFVDGIGRTISIESAVNVAVPGDGVYVVYWDSSANTFAIVLTSTTSGLNDADTPVGIVVRAGGVIAPDDVISIMPRGVTVHGKREITVGAASGGTNGPMFSNLEAALLFAAVFNSSLDLFTRPSVIKVVSNANLSLNIGGVNSLDFGASWWAGIADRVSNMTITGEIGPVNSPEKAELRMNVSDGPGIVGGQAADVRNLKFENLKFVERDGVGLGGSTNGCFFLSPGPGWQFKDVVFDGNAAMNYLAVWLDTFGEVLGGLNASGLFEPFKFDNCICVDMFENVAGNAVFYWYRNADSTGGSIPSGNNSTVGHTGVLDLRDFKVSSTNTYEYIFDIGENRGFLVNISWDGGSCFNFDGAIFNHYGVSGFSLPPKYLESVSDHKKDLRNLDLRPNSGTATALVDTTGTKVAQIGMINMLNCVIDGQGVAPSFAMDGVRNAIGLEAKNDITIIGSGGVYIDCNFSQDDANWDGSMSTGINCLLDLLPASSLVGEVSTVGDPMMFINMVVTKDDSTGGIDYLLETPSSGNLVVSGGRWYSGGGTATENSMINWGCDLRILNSEWEMFGTNKGVMDETNSNDNFMMSGCTIVASGDGAYWIHSTISVNSDSIFHITNNKYEHSGGGTANDVLAITDTTLRAAKSAVVSGNDFDLGVHDYAIRLINVEKASIVGNTVVGNNATSIEIEVSTLYAGPVFATVVGNILVNENVGGDTYITIDGDQPGGDLMSGVCTSNILSSAGLSEIAGTGLVNFVGVSNILTGASTNIDITSTLRYTLGNGVHSNASHVTGTNITV